MLAQVNPALAVRVNWSEGFALPSDFAKYALGARNLEANVFRQTELGLRWKPSAQWLVDAAALPMVFDPVVPCSAARVDGSRG